MGNNLSKYSVYRKGRHTYFTTLTDARAWAYKDIHNDVGVSRMFAELSGEKHEPFSYMESVYERGKKIGDVFYNVKVGKIFYHPYGKSKSYVYRLNSDGTLGKGY